MASDMLGIMFPNLPEKVSVSLYMGSDDFMEQLSFIAKALVDRIKLDMNPTLCDVIMSTDHKPSLPSHLMSPFGTEREKLKL